MLPHRDGAASRRPEFEGEEQAGEGREPRRQDPRCDEHPGRARRGEEQIDPAEDDHRRDEERGEAAAERDQDVAGGPRFRDLRRREPESRDEGEERQQQRRRDGPAGGMAGRVRGERAGTDEERCRQGRECTERRPGSGET